MTHDHRTLSLFVLALGLGLGGCDQPVDDAPEVGFRSLGGIGTGSKLTLNTNQWASSSARDVYEFSRLGEWHTNSYGFESKLAGIALPNTPYGPVSHSVGAPPLPGQPRAEIIPGSDFKVSVHGPAPTDPVHVLDGAELFGLELTFSVKDFDAQSDHPVILRFVDHLEDPEAGDFYDIVKIDPTDGETIGPLCEADAGDYRLAHVFDGLVVDSDTGEMDFVGGGIHHIGCSASAPAKALLFGYDPATLTIQSWILANRVVRADYCADGHPYTYPGNLVGIEDNFRGVQQGKTLADVQASLAPEEVVEAVWDENGVLCVGSPRASNVERLDIVCPVKHHSDGTTSYNWRPPACGEFVDTNPAAMRFFSKASL